ncbi:b8f423c1-c868-4e87-821d-5cc926225ef5 [Sclerotinia trifoliorum]|uniref:B8f423c1-c868-4e87-821d-5cc926225ef5 n=1 Tax=Sclerotinia trifoliorum TaxID=28548 RepID=A0A8H2VTY7_9HELO|nr:b8f423c1-c868-4e87-821d-5cc926225ef5 [Sclerotinia trifoliorum]
MKTVQLRFVSLRPFCDTQNSSLRCPMVDMVNQISTIIISNGFESTKPDAAFRIEPSFVNSLCYMPCCAHRASPVAESPNVSSDTFSASGTTILVLLSSASLRLEFPKKANTLFERSPAVLFSSNARSYLGT